jgi:cytoplasmic iron level regulating protein YaaA (DUF328/UPF0246 family)
MQPYRLEMGTELKHNGWQNLYEFWGEVLTGKLNEAIKSHSVKTIVNLASDEYYKSLNTGQLKARILKCQFKEERDGQLKFVTIYGKKARGRMARFILENQIDHEEDLKAFDLDGYHFNSEYSTDDLFMYSRES